MTSIEIDDVGEGVEGVKRDADREDDLEDTNFLGAGCGEHLVEGFGGEHVVFEEGEESEVGRDARGDSQFPFALCGARAGDDFTPEEIEDCGEEHQPCEPRLPPSVKEIAAKGDPDISPAVREIVVDQQKEGQKIENENLAGEDHALISEPAWAAAARFSSESALCDPLEGRRNGREDLGRNLTTKVQYRGGVRLYSVGDMKKVRSTKSSVREKGRNFRSVARFHALGLEAEIAPERKRLLDLALNEAEALACETGVPELVLLTLAEEKVRATRQWLARQDEFRNRSVQWQLAA